VEQALWDRLLEAAREAAGRAYIPYSHYSVGAAAFAVPGGDGIGATGHGSGGPSLAGARLVTGCNVENASLGLTLCAECGLISALAASGGGRLVAFACVHGPHPGDAVPGAGELIMPCGRCRQLLYEHGGGGLLLLTPLGERTLDQMLPQAFGPQNLEG
jgi:cytidine deaminase